MIMPRLVSRPRIFAIPIKDAEALENSISAIVDSSYLSMTEEEVSSILLNASKSVGHLWSFLQVANRRLEGCKHWAIACKVLYLVHHLNRNGSPSIETDMRSILLDSRDDQALSLDKISHAFCDATTSPLAADRTEIIRRYAAYIHERILCTASVTLAGQGSAPGCGSDAGQHEWRGLMIGDVICRISALQSLLDRLAACQPSSAVGPSKYCFLVDSLGLLLRDSFEVYSRVNYGMMELVERFGMMGKDEALTSMEIFRRAAHQSESLTLLYQNFGEMGIGKNVDFPSIAVMGESYLKSLEAFLKDDASVSSPEARSGRLTPANCLLSLQIVPVVKTKVLETSAQKAAKAAAAQQFDDTWKALFATDRFSARQNPNPQQPSTSHQPNNASWHIQGANSWTPSCHQGSPLPSLPPQLSLPGGFDELLLNSLYDAALAQRRVYSCTNTSVDPFAASNGVEPPAYVQMAVRAQKQMAMLLQRNLMARHLYYSSALRGGKVPREVMQELVSASFDNCRNPDNVGVQYGSVLIPYS